jgi:hypothetical protein
LAVEDSGVIVISDRITFAPFRGLSSIRIGNIDGPNRTTFEVAALDVADRERMLYYSRYPAGLRGERLATLLAVHGQTTLDFFPAAAGVQRLEEAAELTARRLATPEAAAAAGYRPLGPDFPGMGQHWVNLRILMSAELSLEEPAVLSYTDVGGKPTLVNVGHTVVLDRGGTPLALSGVSPEAWHTHSGTVEEEMIGEHRSDMGHELAGLIATMLHVWRIPNPEGSLAQHNWLLPFRALGLPDPEGVPGEWAAQALWLTTKPGEAYRLRIMRALVDPERLASGEDMLAARAQNARDWLERMRPAQRISAEDLIELEVMWRTFGHELSGLAADADSRSRLRELHGLDEHRAHTSTHGP